MSFKWQIPKCRTTKILNVLTVIIMLGTFLYAVLIFRSLPDQVPVHINYKGEAGRWGNKGAIFMFPLIMILPITIVYFLGKFPHYLHQGELKETDKDKYIFMRKYLSGTNVVVALLAFYLTWSVAQIAHDRYAFQPWADYIFLGLIGILWIRFGILYAKKWPRNSKGNYS